MHRKINKFFAQVDTSSKKMSERANDGSAIRISHAHCAMRRGTNVGQILCTGHTQKTRNSNQFCETPEVLEITQS
jgi:hypothetical protein